MNLFVSVKIYFHNHTEVHIETVSRKKNKRVKIFIKRNVYYIFCNWRSFLSKYFSWYVSFKNDTQQSIITFFLFFFLFCFAIMFFFQVTTQICQVKYLNKLPLSFCIGTDTVILDVIRTKSTVKATESAVW